MKSFRDTSNGLWVGLKAMPVRPDPRCVARKEGGAFRCSVVWPWWSALRSQTRAQFFVAKLLLL
eukprot:9376247-Pyramimonas_sp.AAC.1